MTFNEVSPQEILSDTSVTRRSSTSSVETVTSERIRGSGAKNKKRKEKANEPCSSCEHLLFNALTTQSAQKVSRSFASIHDLQRSAKKCPMCGLLWLILRGTDNSLVDQILRYGDNDFNSTGLYNPDGGTDIDELLNPGSKVKISVTAGLEYLPKKTVSRALLDNSQAAALSLRFDISYRTHAGSRTDVTTIQEDVTIFRDSGSVCNDAVESDPDKLPRYLSRLPLDPRLDSSGKWDLLVSWLARCPQPPLAYNRDTFPSRVLDLSREGQVSLLVAPRGPYVALSHRWGSSQHLVLTSHVLDKMKSGISIDLLPMTFRDAVSVTRRLGIFSLWIDALCIVQDDRADWQSESMKMGDIFMNAKFVIAAHCAADDSEGFLTKALSKCDAIGFRVSGSDERVCVCRRANLEIDVTSSVLSKRGWVLQERFLAMHTLHFTSCGVFSETPTEVFSEDGPLTPKSLMSVGTTFFGPSALPQLRAMLTGTDKTKAAEAHYPQTQMRTPLEWLTLVEMYTNCDLSREEDKLFAISGIARKIRSCTDSSWCAGLWSDQICEGLLWFSEHGLSSPTNPRAPSWSWAAWDGPIQYPTTVENALFQPRAKFISVHGANPSSKSTGKVWLDGPGAMRIQAKIISLENVMVTGDCVQLGPGPDRRGYLTNDNRDLPRLGLKHYLTAYALRGLRSTNKRLIVREDQLPPCGWVTLDDHNFARTRGSDIDSYCLQNCCFAILGIHYMPSDGLMYLGVYLCPVEDCEGQAVEYRRVGCGQMSHSFMSREKFTDKPWNPDELGWSTRSDDVPLHIPLDLSTLSTITIR